MGSDELARLARTFNRRSTRSSSSVQSQRNLVADASHELRTPIATIRANLQLMRDEELLSPEDRAALRADVIEELDELTALVGDVVELARGSKPSAEPGDVRLDAIVDDAIERARRRAPTLTFHQVIEPTLVQRRGRPDLARGDATCSTTRPSGARRAASVEVTLHDGVVTVRDHGPGFKEDDLPYVFDRFHRARDARSKPGSGSGAGDRPPGRRGARRLRRGGQRAGRGRDPAGRLRAAARARDVPAESAVSAPDPSRAAPLSAIGSGSGASRGSWRASARVPRSASRRPGSVRVASSTSRSGRSSSAGRRSPSRDGSRAR